MALAFRNMGELEQSVASIKKALKIRPDYPEALINLGIYQNDCGFITKAISNYKKALKIYPSMRSPEIMIKEIEALIKEDLI